MAGDDILIARSVEAMQAYFADWYEFGNCNVRYFSKWR